MKNIHILPTDKPSILFTNRYGEYKLHSGLATMPLDSIGSNQNVYITSKEKPKVGDWVVEFQKEDDFGEVHFINGEYLIAPDIQQKIILTDAPDLIKDGVQAIPNEFLEWFVKNPSCEKIDIVKEGFKKNGMIDEATSYRYKIIIPKEETKQETLKEVAEKEYPIYMHYGESTVKHDANKEFREAFINGAKWQAERMYSEEEVKLILVKLMGDIFSGKAVHLNEWFNQFKKK